MKRQIFIIFIFSLLAFTSCNDNPKFIKYSKDLYFNNLLDKNISLEVFKGDELLTFELKPNDTTYFTTCEYLEEDGAVYTMDPFIAAYEIFVCHFDSINVIYNNKSYMYKSNWMWAHTLLKIDSFCNGKYIINFDESKKNHYGWEE